MLKALLREFAAALIGALVDMVNGWVLRQRLAEAEARAATLEAAREGDLEAREAYEKIKAATADIEPVADWESF